MGIYYILNSVLIFINKPNKFINIFLRLKNFEAIVSVMNFIFNCFCSYAMQFQYYLYAIYSIY